jgi:pyridinium-3,5-biscarboxylic acid mononucleotide sulfurtransferase
MQATTNEKLVALRQLIGGLDRGLIAYSGGVDSTLVAKVAYDCLGEKSLAVTAASPSLLPEELEDAQIQAAVIGITHQVVRTNELDNPEYRANPVNRCYFCKSELHDTLKPLAQKLGYPYVLDGVNADDLQDYRPGIQAAKERGARSPLAELGITKLEVREIAKYLGLTVWDKPAQPCLSSRFPYGEEISIDKLHRVGRAEIYLRKLGYEQLRVRSIGNTAKIELPAELIGKFASNSELPAIIQALQDLGFTFVTLDLEGFASGKLNRVLEINLVDAR